MFEATRVDRFGFYKRDTEEADTEGWYEVREVMNYAQQALDIAQSEGKDREAGMSFTIVDTRR